MLVWRHPALFFSSTPGRSGKKKIYHFEMEEIALILI